MDESWPTITRPKWTRPEPAPAPPDPAPRSRALEKQLDGLRKRVDVLESSVRLLVAAAKRGLKNDG